LEESMILILEELTFLTSDFGLTKK
jgi:hypothetical protein